MFSPALACSCAVPEVLELLGGEGLSEKNVMQVCCRTCGLPAHCASIRFTRACTEVQHAPWPTDCLPVALLQCSTWGWWSSAPTSC